MLVKTRLSFDGRLDIIRACTGFDGGFAIVAAIRGPGPRSKPENLNINADENLAYAA